MPAGAVLLSDYPGHQVRVVCQPCATERAYSLPRLIRRHEADAGLPDVLARITADCMRRQDWRQHGPCQGHYPDLAPRPTNA